MAKRKQMPGDADAAIRDLGVRPSAHKGRFLIDVTAYPVDRGDG